MEGERTFFVPRHTKKTKSEQEGSNGFMGVTAEGEQIVRERTRTEVRSVIDAAPANGLVIFGGASELARTKSSTRISGSELKDIYADDENVIILDEAAIEHLTEGQDEKHTRKALQEFVTANQDKKIVIINPLAIQELSLAKSKSTGGRNAGKEDWKHWEAGKEVFSPYLTALMKKHDNNEFNALADWVATDGEMETEAGKLEGPKPLGVAQGYAKSLERLDDVASKLFPGRPLVIEATGHSWDIDTFVTYLANGGKLDPEKLKEVARGTGDSETIISEFEFPVIKVAGEKGSVTYRGKTYEFDSKLLSK